MPIELVTLNDRDPIVEPEETGATFDENARLKARYYSQATGLVSVADDSGLEIDALDKSPGVHSARWHGTDYPTKFRKIQELFRERGVSGSTARFVCSIAVARGDAIIFEARGTVEGEIVRRTARLERLRIRSDFLVSSSRLHACRTRSRAEGDGQSPREGVQRIAAIPHGGAEALERTPYCGSRTPGPGSIHRTETPARLETVLPTLLQNVSRLLR